MAGPMQERLNAYQAVFNTYWQLILLRRDFLRCLAHRKRHVYFGRCRYCGSRSTRPGTVVALGGLF